MHVYNNSNNFRSAHKMISQYLTKTVTFDACPNDCILFRGDFAELTECPMCESSRYKRGTIPNKTFIYMPLGPRLERIFSTSNLAKIVQAHGYSYSPSSHQSYDIHDSPSWKEAYGTNGIFAGDKRGIALALCTDGVNPFSHTRVAYSMWPIMFSLLNLPRSIRNLFQNIWLVGIIPGNGTGEPKSLSPYLEVVVDEMLMLSSSKLFDAYQKADFNLKVELFLSILDYPGISKVFGVSGSGAYQGCMWCKIKGNYNYSTITFNV